MIDESKAFREDISMKTPLSMALRIALAVFALATAANAQKTPSVSDSAKRQADQKALAPLAGLVGDWRGVGQPKRGSAKDNWREQSQWIWKLDAKSAALFVQFSEGKYLKSLRLSSAKDQTIEAEAISTQGQKRLYSGKINEKNVLVLTPNEPQEGEPARITLSVLHETRHLILLERKKAGANSPFERIAEVGYTRQGVAFAASGDGYPVCIVTGGRGTIQVSHKGKTYWVCCSGCKDLFDEDPEAVLAEAATKKK